MTSWFDTEDPDVRWIMRENLKKKRLEPMDTEWVEPAKMWLESTTEEVVITNVRFLSSDLDSIRSGARALARPA